MSIVASLIIDRFAQMVALLTGEPVAMPPAVPGVIHGPTYTPNDIGLQVLLTDQLHAEVWRQVCSEEVHGVPARPGRAS
jgi:hypothetical protein